MWWRRCHILLNGMSREDDLALQRDIYSFYRSLVGNSGLTEESFNHSQRNAKETFNNILHLLRPWTPSAESLQAEEFKSLRQQYVEAFGDPADPEWQAQQAIAIEEFKRRSREMELTSEDAQMAAVERRRREQLARKTAESQERQRRRRQGR
jgi:hypothetical protein